jgi:peptide/nickel transport system permease protein
MTTFLLNRAWQSVLLLVLVSIISFTLLKLAPGSPLAQFAFSPGMTQVEMQKIAAQMGLDKPALQQYFEWAGHILKGDWGASYRDGRPVLTVIFDHLGPTMLLMGCSMLLSIASGITIGVVSAARRNSSFDYIMTTVAMVALSIPTFWFGLIAIYIFSVKLGWLPSGNMSTIGDGDGFDLAEHLVLPVVVLAMVDIASWSRYMRASTLEAINQEYVKTARAKGVGRRAVLWRHVFRNALLPMIPLAGLQLPTLFGGALVTETVFTWPGMGRLFLDSLNYNDYPVVLGLVMFSAIFVLVGSLLADVAVSVADPRIRLG